MNASRRRTEAVSPYRIDIADEQCGLLVDHDWLRGIVESVLRAERVAGAEISVALVDDERIHAVNREFLGHDCPTDVVSFVLDEFDPVAVPVPPVGIAAGAAPPRGSGRRFTGEVVASTTTAVRMGAECRWSPHSELALYVVHGVLHLCGYDDSTARERAIMRRREAAVLAPWRITPRFL